MKNLFKWLGQNWFKFFIVLAISMALVLVSIWFLGFIDPDLLSEDSDCNVRGIVLRGEIVTYTLEDGPDSAPLDQTSSDDVIYAINEAENNPDIKTILVEIDSFGGFPVAAEEIANAIKQAVKPTVAQIRESGVSAAYWVATGADKIFASANSDVGSIGVTQSYLQNVIKNRNEGLEYVELRAGRLKDTGSPDKPLTAEEKRILQRDLNILHDNFIKAVAQNRDIPIADVRKLADGSSMLGVMALQNKLVDEIGGFSEVKEYLRGLIADEPSICWY